jgi:hypothetical protein
MRLHRRFRTKALTCAHTLHEGSADLSFELCQLVSEFNHVRKLICDGDATRKKHENDADQTAEPGRP